MARHRRLTKSRKRRNDNKRARKSVRQSIKTGRAGKMIRRTRWAERPEQPLPEDDA